MKKILAIAIALVMMLAISVPAFAAELTPEFDEGTDTAGIAYGSLTVYNEEDGTYTAEDFDELDIPVYGVLDSDGDNIPDTEEPGEVVTTVVYDFNISWDSMEFVYSTTWDPSSLSYETKFNDSPQGGINVENRSNAAIAVDLSFTAESNFTGGLEFSLNDSGLEEELAGLTYTENTVADDNGLVDPLKGVSSVEIAAAVAGTTDAETGESTGTAYDADFIAMVTEGSTMELGENVTRAQIGTITVTVSRVAPEVVYPEELADTFNFDTELSDRGTYSVKAGKTYTLRYFEAKDCTISLTSVTDSSGATVADTDFVTTEAVDTGDDDSGYTSTMTFTCNDALIGETLSLVINGEADGYDFENTLTLQVVAAE